MLQNALQLLLPGGWGSPVLGSCNLSKFWLYTLWGQMKYFRKTHFVKLFFLHPVWEPWQARLPLQNVFLCYYSPTQGVTFLDIFGYPQLHCAIFDLIPTTWRVRDCLLFSCSRFLMINQDFRHTCWSHSLYIHIYNIIYILGCCLFLILSTTSVIHLNGCF